MFFHEKHVINDDVPMGWHQLQGNIISFSQINDGEKKWLLNIKQWQTQIWLHCKKNCPTMYPGETWLIQGRMWKKNVFNNPGSRNIWYQESFRHISGHLQLQHAKRIHSISTYNLIAKIRKNLYVKAYDEFKDTFSRALFLTLVLGVGSELTCEDWTVFKDTGTAHLMVVSGAHLSLFIAMITKIVQGLVYICPIIVEKIPSKRLSSLIGLGLGGIYAWICGLGIPVQRAWIMAFIAHFHYWGNRQFNSWQGWMLAMWFILIIEPHALWYPGFYLSFGSVGIFIWMAHSSIKSQFYKNLLSQLMCIIGLGPLSILWFKNISMVGLFANFIAIPWVSWIILPLSLLCAITWSSWITYLFVRMNHYFHQALFIADQFKHINLNMEWDEPKMAWIMFILFIAFVLLPNYKLRACLIVLQILCLIPHSYVLRDGEFISDFLDVGQGLSILIKTKHHQLIYDTGGSGQFWTMAERIIIPYLNHEHIKSINKIIVSHPDLDHRGGLRPLMELFPKAEIIVDKPNFYHFGKSCLHENSWRWDGVRFKFLKAKLSHASKNNHSCVLQIDNYRFKLLLTGDIEHGLESKLIQLPIKATVLQVPHHGSYTSSTIKFLKKVKPQLAIVSVGLHNRYHLPNLKIIKRYQDLHIPWMSTADLGMIRVIFKQKNWYKKSNKSMNRLQFGM